MSVGAARRLEVMVGVGEAVVERVAVRTAEHFVGTPAAGDVALRLQHGEAVFRRAQMLFAARREIGHHRRAQRVHIAVGVTAVQHMLVPRQWIEPGLVIQIPAPETGIARAGAAFRCQEHVLGQGVGFVPGPGGVVGILVHPPPLVVLHRPSRKMGQSRVGRPFQDGKRLRIVRQAVGIQQPDSQLVVGVGWKTALGVEFAGDGLGVEPVEPQHLFANGAVAANRVAPGQGRHPLAEVAAGREAFVEVCPIIVVGAIGVPAAQLDARRGQTGHLAERHQQAVVAQGHQHRLGIVQSAPHARRWRSTPRHSRIQRAEQAGAARLPVRQRRGRHSPPSSVRRLAEGGGATGASHCAHSTSCGESSFWVPREPRA